MNFTVTPKRANRWAIVKVEWPETKADLANVIPASILAAMDAAVAGDPPAHVRSSRKEQAHIATAYAAIQAERDRIATRREELIEAGAFAIWPATKSQAAAQEAAKLDMLNDMLIDLAIVLEDADWQYLLKARRLATFAQTTTH